MPQGKKYTDEDLNKLKDSSRNKILRDRRYRENNKQNNQNLEVKDIKRKPKKDEQREILMNQDHKCAICKVYIDDTHIMIEYDHIKEWCNGGETTINNLRALCRNCHKGRHLSWAKNDEKRKEHTKKIIKYLQESLEF